MGGRGKFAAVAGAIVLLVVVAAAVAGRWSARPGAVQDVEGGLEALGDYGEVPPFTLTERSGRRIGRDDLRGLFWLVDFIYTECQETCPVQSLASARLQEEFSDVAELRLVSITVDPEHDTPEVLQRYALRYGAGERWWFLTGSRQQIYCLATQGFRLAVSHPVVTAEPECGPSAWLGPTAAWASHGSGGLIMHSARLVLVDRRGHIRAYHLATDPDSMARLRKNVSELLASTEHPPRR